MSNAIKILVILLSAPLVVLGVGAMFNAVEMAAQFGIQPQGIPGLSTLRADIGGLLLGSAILMLLGVWRNNTTWLLAAAVMMGVVAFGRLVGFIFDGFDAALVTPLVVELVIVGVMVGVHHKLS